MLLCSNMSNTDSINAGSELKWSTSDAHNFWSVWLIIVSRKFFFISTHAIQQLFLCEFERRAILLSILSSIFISSQICLYLAMLLCSNMSNTDSINAGSELKWSTSDAHNFWSYESHEFTPSTMYWWSLCYSFSHLMSSQTWFPEPQWYQLLQKLCASDVDHLSSLQAFHNYLEIMFPIDVLRFSEFRIMRNHLSETLMLNDIQITSDDMSRWVVLKRRVGAVTNQRHS
jgi:hypothetical protein